MARANATSTGVYQHQHSTAVTARNGWHTQPHKHASHGHTHTPQRRTRQGKTETQRPAAAAALRDVRAPTSLPAHRRLPAATRPWLADPVYRRSTSAKRGRSWHPLPSTSDCGLRCLHFLDSVLSVNRVLESRFSMVLGDSVIQVLLVLRGLSFRVTATTPTQRGRPPWCACWCCSRCWGW